MIIYFAEPIDQDRSDFVEGEFRDLVVKHLLGKGHSVYRPSTAWSLSSIDPDTSSSVEEVNREALRQADLLVARLPEGVASVGVPMEIEYATRALGIPAIVIGGMGVALQANPNVWLTKGRDLHEFDQVFDALAATSFVGPTFLHTGNLAERSYPGDAGIDLIASEDITIQPGQTARVPTGNRFEFPPGVWGWIVSRSSTFDKFGVLVLPGIIDEGYTGELFANAFNPGTEPVTIRQGNRVCQIILFDNVTARYTPVQVDAVRERDRGSNGFGSTGGH